jgi:hypothetical protein
MGQSFHAIHMALIPTAGPLRGKVLAWDYNPGPNSTSTGTQRWSILDPTLSPSQPEAFKNFKLTGIPQDGATNQDLACAGFTWLPDGTMLVAGGTQKYGPRPIIGARLLYKFKPALWTPSTPNAAWDRVPNITLQNKRWYPTVALGTRPWVYIHRGHTDDSTMPIGLPDDFETWRHDLNVFFGQTRPGPKSPADINILSAYPRMHLLSNGRIFQAGFDKETFSKKNPDDAWLPQSVSAHEYRAYGTSVRFPNIDARHTDAVMILGGQSGPTDVLDSVQICKASAAAPGSFHDAIQGWDWTPPWPADGSLPNMQNKRYKLNAVLLPDATVLVVGGTSSPEGSLAPVYAAERFKGGQWDSLNDLRAIRDYHFGTLLLPSGKVLIAGGENRNLGKPPGEPSRDYEVFSPPYMFKPRPQWTQDPQENVAYGGTYPVHFEMPSGAALARVVLMRPGCNTHHFDADQRYYQAVLNIPLEEETSPRWYTLPTNQDALPPGYYMIWLVTGDGVPSEARWVNVQP